MSQENFQQLYIDQNVAVANIPVLTTSRQSSIFNQIRSCQSHQIDLPIRKVQSKPSIQDLLYGKKRDKQNIKPNQFDKQQLLIKKLYQHQDIVKNKIQLKKKQIEDSLQQGCTFQPQINNKDQRRRTLNQFLDSQNKFIKKVYQNKAKTKQAIEFQQKQLTFKPKINKISNNSSSKQPTYKRLYNLRNNQQNSNNLSNKVSQYTFIPIITEKAKQLKRESPIEDHLYKDALRRKDKKQQIKKLLVSNNKQKQQKPLNLNNQKYVSQRFYKEYFRTLQDLNIDTNQNRIQFSNFILILQKMNFIPIIQEDNVQFLKDVSEIYQLLEKYSASAKNISIVLLTLLGIYHILPIDSISLSVQQSERNELRFDQVQGKKFKSRYERLFRHRMHSDGMRKKNIQQSYSFKPEINENSEILAQTYRNRILQQTNNLVQQKQLNISLPSDGYLTHADLLNLNKKVKQLEFNKRRQSLKNDDLKLCTFKPIINQNKKQLSLTNQNTSKNKCLELYQLSKIPKKQIKKSLQIQFQKNIQQCTFVPKINKKFCPQIFTSLTQRAKNYDKSIFRMVQGRKIRQQKSHFLSMHQSQAVCQSYRSKCENINETNEQQIPFLVIDINIGQKIQQMIIYKQNIKNFDLLALQFSKKHGLDEQSYQKLLEMLKIQIQKILQNIQSHQQSNLLEN